MKSKFHELTIVGLGKIGGNLARHALEKGLRVYGMNKDLIESDLPQMGLKPLDRATQIKDFVRSPRLILLYVPAGHAVDGVIELLADQLEPGDIIIDGGNSYWKDSIARYQKLKTRGLNFVDMGTSGGPDGARHGACFMVGGEKEVVREIEPLLKSLAVKGGFVYAGPPGCGHFTKLVHNGIEFGMMQAIGEGVDILEHQAKALGLAEPLNVENILECWRHGSVIRSWLMDLVSEGYKQAPHLASIPGYVEDTGEVNWLVQDAVEMEVPIPVIAQSVWQLFLSRDNVRVWAKAIAAMRHGFGGHPFGPDSKLRESRKHSRGTVEASH